MTKTEFERNFFYLVMTSQIMIIIIIMQIHFNFYLYYICFDWILFFFTIMLKLRITTCQMHYGCIFPPDIFVFEEKVVP